ncbi:Fungal specific transcription factor domain-containing protein [Cladophialophora immunda]|nr:Fungal specific transcription factor domain-containing protein [Cladophialophora immunda]
MAKIASKNSCRTCRLRKLKCDEKLPTCSRCERSGRWCDRTAPLKIQGQKNVRKRTNGAKGTDSIEQNSVERFDEPRVRLQNEEIAHYFAHYLKTLAPWYDLNDLRQAFKGIVGSRAQQSSLLLSAVIAFAAIHKSRTCHAVPKSLAERHHAHCLRLLIGITETSPEIKDGTALAATCLLRSYEILAEEEDPNRHLFGAFSLIPSLSCSLPDEPLLRAGLWNYLREDITFSLINRCPLKIEVGAIDIELCRDDDYANQITILLARVINAAFADGSELLVDLQSAISAWNLSVPFQPYHESHEGVLPKIQMVEDCHVAAMQYWHVAQILLDLHTGSPVDFEAHARAICGMAFSANSDPVVVNSYGPICYSAQWLSRDDARRELVNHLLDSQKRTGWPVQAIIKKLKHSWAGEAEK